MPVVPSPSTTSLSWRSGLSSSSESDMVPTPPAGKEKRRRAAGRDGVQERGGEAGKERAPRSRSRRRCRGRSRHLPSARRPSLWPARDDTNGGEEGRGESVARGRELQQRVHRPLRAQAGATRDAPTSVPGGPSPPRSAAGRMVQPDSPLRAAVV